MCTCLISIEFAMHKLKKIENYCFVYSANAKYGVVIKTLVLLSIINGFIHIFMVIILTLFFKFLKWDNLC